MPLIRSFWLSKKKNRKVWARPVAGTKSVQFEISYDQKGPTVDGTVGARGAICLCCKETSTTRPHTQGRAVEQNGQATHGNSRPRR